MCMLAKNSETGKIKEMTRGNLFKVTENSNGVKCKTTLYRPL